MALLASILLIVIDYRSGLLLPVRNIAATLVYPFQLLAALPVSTASWLSEATASNRDLREENSRLRDDNLQLRRQLQRLEALESENMRLRDLFDSSIKVGDRSIIAELVSVDLDPYRHEVMINKGRGSGAFVGQPVLDADGVMGQIVEANAFNSRVLMITDPSHALPVRNNRTGLQTIAVGSGIIDQLELPYLPNSSDISLGDLLITSGLGGRFPPGYPVARITHIHHTPGQAFATVLATPVAELDRVHEVLLISSIAPPALLRTHPEPAGDPEAP